MQRKPFRVPGTPLSPWEGRYGVIPEPLIEGVVILQKAGSPGTFLNHLLRTEGGRSKGHEGFPVPLPQSELPPWPRGTQSRGFSLPLVPVKAVPAAVTDRPPNPGALAPGKCIFLFICSFCSLSQQRRGRGGTLPHSHSRAPASRNCTLLNPVPTEGRTWESHGGSSESEPGDGTCTFRRNAPAQPHSPTWLPAAYVSRKGSLNRG